jgi:N6-adenosine-specific RNA methylase IME4
MAKESRALVNGSKLLATIGYARRHLAKTTDLMEVLDIRDQAEALRHLQKTADAGLDAQNAAAELKIRAERRAGELLVTIDRKHRGGSKFHDGTLKLADLGIEKKESHRFQRIAALPEKEFQRYLIEAAEERKELTSVEVRRRAKEYLRTKKRAVDAQHGAERAKGVIVTDIADLAGKTFGTIYADPPWKYGNQSTRAATGKHYETLTPEQLCAMPVADLAADDAHLHLWTTNAFLREAFDVIEGWGFEYRSVFVWCKPQMGIGNYWRVSHEFLMLGVRGDAKQFGNHEQMSWALLDRTKHSRKPEEIREMVEAVSFGPYLELFGRRPVDGWTVFGNEVEPNLFVQ